MDPRPAMEKLFIGGCPRSGTTLLAALLNASPVCRAMPEARFKFALLGEDLLTRKDLEILAADFTFHLWRMPSVIARLEVGAPRFQAFDDIVSEALSPDPGIRFYVDHTPRNVRHLPALRHFYPDSRFIHIIRDGRGVWASVKSLPWGPNSPGEAARWWTRSVALGLAAAAICPDSLWTIRYEDLVDRPAEVLQGLCDWLGIPFEPTMLEGDASFLPEYTHDQHRLVGEKPDPAAARRWRGTLPPHEIKLFEDEAADLIVALGYDLMDLPVPVPAWRRLAIWLGARVRRRNNRRRYRRKQRRFWSPD